MDDATELARTHVPRAARWWAGKAPADGPPIGSEPLALGLRKGEKGLKAVVDQTLRELESSGAAEGLFNKWYGPGTRTNLAKRGFKIHTDQI